MLFENFLLATAFSALADAQNFKHPGIFISKAQLDHAKSNINNAPYAAALKDLNGVWYASSSWQPKPVANVVCTGNGVGGEVGCAERRTDGLSAYANALRWAVTGDKASAQGAIRILDAWSSTLKSQVPNEAWPPQVGLDSGWVTSTFTRAAEILKYTNAGWSQSGQDAFKNMLLKLYLPELLVPKADNPNNVELVMLEAVMNIAVYTDDRTLYNSVLPRIAEMAASYIYIDGDKNKMPNPPLWTVKKNYYSTEAGLRSLWRLPEGQFVHGQMMETCRDLPHASYGLASISHMMETAYIQGNDLYGSNTAERLKAALEKHAASNFSGMCNGRKPTGTMEYVLEPVLNAFQRRGEAPSYKATYVNANRPAKQNSVFVGFETLTHGENPK
ncbi:Fc.00g044620.m01.CDS01 [Cosmosporella sp. VM-42]